MATLCAASWPYEVASETIQRFIGVSLCPKEIQLLTEPMAQEVKEKENQGFIEALSSTTKTAMEQLDPAYQPVEERDEHKRVYLGFDGIYVHGWDSPNGIEGKVGIVFSGDDDDTTQISKGRNVLLKKEYLASFETSETLARKAYAVVWNNDFLAEEMIVLGDGAQWIRKIRHNYFNEARYILDWWHLKEKVKRCLRDTLTDRQTRWRKAKQILALLWEGKWKAALRVLDQLSIERRDGQNQEVLELRKYINNNAEGIVDYKAFKQAGYYISSSIVEKTADIIVARRQKHQGMIWSRKGADAIAVLRTVVLNGKWDSYWQEKKAA
jgi:hypothetical protein